MKSYAPLYLAAVVALPLFPLAAQQLAVRSTVPMSAARAAEYLAIAEGARKAQTAEDVRSWQHRIDSARDTLAAALDWFASHDEGKASLRLLIAVDRFWSDVPDLVRHYDRAFDIPSSRKQTLMRARALYLASRDAHHLADQRRVRLWANESIAISRQLGDSAGIGRGYTRLVFAALRDGDHRALRALADTGAPFCYQREASCYAEFFNMRAESARVLRQYDSAVVYYSKANDVSMPASGRLHNIGFALLGLGRVDEARADFTEGLRRFVARGDRVGCAFLLAGLASAAVADKKASEAGELFGVSDALLLQAGAKADPADAVEYERYRERGRALLGVTAFTEAVRRGTKLRADSVIAAVLK